MFYESDSLYIDGDGANNGYIDTAYISTPYPWNTLMSVFDTMGNICRIKTIGSPNSSGTTMSYYISSRPMAIPFFYIDSIFIDNNLFTSIGKSC